MKATLIAAILLGASFFAHAKTEANLIEVKEGYIFQPMSGSNATAGYGSIKNTSGKEVILTIVSAEGFKATELHETISEKGMMKMQKMENIRLAKSGTFELKPGGNHIMLFDPTEKFKEGDVVKVTFNAGDQKIVVPFKIRPRAEDAHKHH